MMSIYPVTQEETVAGVSDVVGNYFQIRTVINLENPSLSRVGIAIGTDNEASGHGFEPDQASRLAAFLEVAAQRVGRLSGITHAHVDRDDPEMGKLIGELPHGFGDRRKRLSAVRPPAPIRRANAEVHAWCWGLEVINQVTGEVLEGVAAIDIDEGWVLAIDGSGYTPRYGKWQLRERDSGRIVSEAPAGLEDTVDQAAPDPVPGDY